MSEELFPRIQLVYEAVEVGDFDAAIKAAEPLDPEIIWVPPPDVPDTQHVYRGREAMKNRMIEINEPFENRESELVEFIEAGNRAFAHARLKGHGKGSKAPIVGDLYQVITTREPSATIIRVENFLDRAQALEAAGLSD